MADHNYTADTYEGNTVIFNDCKKLLSEITLPTESFSQFGTSTYSLEDIMVRSINNALGEISNIFEGQAYTYRFAKSSVCSHDSDYSSKIGTPAEDVATMTAKLKSFIESMSVSAPTEGFFSFPSASIASVQIKYMHIDLTNASDEEREKYYNTLCNLDFENLSEYEREKIDEYLAYSSNINVTDNMSDKDKKVINQYVFLYGETHTKERNELTNFFNYSTPDDGWRNEEKEAISYLAYRSESPQHDLFFKYIGQCRVSEFNAIKKDENGNIKYNDDGTPKTGCWYDPKDKTIHLNRTCFHNYYLGTYHTIFQEIGHNIDDLMFEGYEWNNGARVATAHGSFSDELNNSLKNDVSNMVWSTIDKYNDNEAWFGIDGPGKQKIYDVIMGNSRFSSLNPRLKWAYGKIYEDISGYWPDVLFSDGYLIRGFDGKIVGKEDGLLNNNTTSAADAVSSQTHGHIGGGHDADYWSNNPYIDNLEVFSEYFASGICNKKDYNLSRELLPQTYAAMDKIVENDLKYSRGTLIIFD